MEKNISYFLFDQNHSLELWKPLYFFQAFLETASKKNFSSRNKKAFWHMKTKASGRLLRLLPTVLGFVLSHN